MTPKLKTEPAGAQSSDAVSVVEKKTNVKNLTEEMISKLKVPLPKEAVSKHPTKAYLSSIKAIYVVERLNDVFGIGKWRQRNEIISDEGKMKTVHSFIDIPEYGIYLDNFGGNDNVDEGDAFKGAVTDALTKMASYLGIGMDVYKGKADTSENRTNTSFPTPTKARPAIEAQKELIKKLMDQKGYSREDLFEEGFGVGTNPSELIKWLIDAKSKVVNGQVQPDAGDTAKILEEERIGENL